MILYKRAEENQLLFRHLEKAIFIKNPNVRKYEIKKVKYEIEKVKYEIEEVICK